MRPLTAQQIIRTWEIGQRQHPLDRALTMLSVACPDQSPEAIAALSVGQRDAYLLTLRELTLGAQLNSFAECPHCGERLETTLNVEDLRVVEWGQPQPQEYVCTIEEFEVQFRLPNSWDLAAIVGYRDLKAAKFRLEERCLVAASRSGVAVTYQELPSDVLHQLADQIAACDPQAEILLDFTCPVCEHEWQLLLDIVTFFWTELSNQAKRLLREVHTLARFYGWREADILAMSTTRRQFYLSLVSQ